MSDLERARIFPGLAIPEDDLRAELGAVLESLPQAIDRLPLSFVVKKNFERLKARLLDPKCQRPEMVIRIEEFQQNMLNDIGSGYFLTLPHDQLPLYLEPVKAFGQVVADKFPETEFDIAAGTRCLALEEWTACVFHFMRVAEKALHWLAKEINVPMSGEIEVQQWGAIIAEIRRRIEAMKNEPRTNARAKKQEAYGELAAHLTAIQSAWRDHVMHSRGRYNQREAEVVWNSTKAFMLRLVDIVPEI